MHQQARNGVINEVDFTSVAEAAQILKTTPQSLYLYLCDSGARGGAKRKRLPKHLYVRIGRKVLFIRSRLIEWVLNGAPFE